MSNKRGKVYTCNGCLAYKRQRRVGDGWSTMIFDAECEIGIEIIKHDKKHGHKPLKETCPKPKNIKELVDAKVKFL